MLSYNHETHQFQVNRKEAIEIANFILRESSTERPSGYGARFPICYEYARRLYQDLFQPLIDAWLDRTVSGLGTFNKTLISWPQHPETDTTTGERWRIRTAHTHLVSALIYLDVLRPARDENGREFHPGVSADVTELFEMYPLEATMKAIRYANLAAAERALGE